jgi:hypothetical protein
MDYIVTFKWSENTYCANWITTDDPNKIDDKYGNKYEWYTYHKANSSEVESVKAKGMPHFNL